MKELVDKTIEKINDLLWSPDNVGLSPSEYTDQIYIVIKASYENKRCRGQALEFYGQLASLFNRLPTIYKKMGSISNYNADHIILEDIAMRSGPLGIN